MRAAGFQARRGFEQRYAPLLPRPALPRLALLIRRLPAAQPRPPARTRRRLRAARVHNSGKSET